MAQRMLESWRGRIAVAVVFVLISRRDHQPGRLGEDHPGGNAPRMSGELSNGPEESDRLGD